MQAIVQPQNRTRGKYPRIRTIRPLASPLKTSPRKGAQSSDQTGQLGRKVAGKSELQHVVPTCIAGPV